MRYYVNNQPQANGDHEVHQATCLFIPKKEKSRIDLREIYSFQDAGLKA